MYKEKSFVSAVVYVRNQEKSIGCFLETLFKELDIHFEKFEIICVNDASTDGSVLEIRKSADHFRQDVLTIMSMSYFHGLELSMNAGIDLSIGDYVFEFDSDIMDYDCETIMQAYSCLIENGYDIVSSSSNASLKLSSRLFYKLFNKFSFGQYHVNAETFRILSRRAVNRIHAMNLSIPYRKAIYANCGLKMRNIEYEQKVLKEKTRIGGHQKYRANLAIDAFLLFTNMGFYCSLCLTIFMMTAAICTAIYTLIIYFMGISIAGWTTTMLFLSAAFGALFAILTIVVKYLAIIVDLIFKKQRYGIAEIQKINGNMQGKLL